MRGTEKQIRWAEDIRANAIAALDCMIRNCERMDSYGDLTLCVDTYRFVRADAEIIKAEVIKRFDAIEDASTIIDLRHNFTQQNFEILAQKLHAGERI